MDKRIKHARETINFCRSVIASGEDFTKRVDIETRSAVQALDELSTRIEALELVAREAQAALDDLDNRFFFTTWHAKGKLRRALNELKKEVND